jgi:hypothetical protein
MDSLPLMLDWDRPTMGLIWTPGFGWWIQSRKAVEGHAPPNSVGKPVNRAARRQEAICVDARWSLEGHARCARSPRHKHQVIL